MPIESTSTLRKFAPAQGKRPGVTAELCYLAPKGQRPYQYMFEPPPGTSRHNCVLQASTTRIIDARALPTPPTIDAAGFELWDAPTSLRSFQDPDAIRNQYYPEAAELAKCVTGAEQVFIFDHAVRRREAGRPALNFGRQGDAGPLGAVGRMHADYTDLSAQKRLSLMLAGQQVAVTPRRFAIVNVWRSICGRILDTPLALCDARTVAASDLIAADLRYPDRTGELYLLQASPHHHWAFFTEMDQHEALVFKQYDSQVSGVSRFTPHSAFDLPDIPDGTKLRESIEIRCLVVYA